MNIAARPIVQAFIGLGANLGEAEQTLKHAAEGLGQLPGSRLVALSSLYRSAPLGPAGQSDYLNAVACLETTLAPHALLAAKCKSIIIKHLILYNNYFSNTKFEASS